MNVASRRFLHNRLILCASARQSSLAAQATAAQAILFRVRSISQVALMCWIRPEWFTTVPRASCRPTIISRNVTAQCDPEHRLVDYDREQVFRLSRR
jgi:hypothetical protein